LFPLQTGAGLAAHPRRKVEKTIIKKEIFIIFAFPELAYIGESLNC